ncbi:phosphoethanolamine transferase [Dechloromonas sp. XY25]|uniref:Phosphoethanolamine transferase n=1 Tax=Dechloromonas hankyongensis TaxID=2908002 RepID=A0ABS9JZG5_9RHOO|nr:phosphoethanolamine--lipid A transferase [Dechloromonas hankyongensis]MCG2576299.1 phosphoethanolamine transferase [Dechloromonas hankyongensis]
MRRPLAALISFAQRLAAGQVVLSIESVLLLASLFFALFCNTMFLSGMLAGYDMARPASWLLGASLFVVLVAVHFVLLGLVATRWTTKPLLAVLFVATAFAVHFMTRYKVYLDTAMLRNVLATDVREARDLMTWSLIPQLLLFAGIPLWVLSRVRLQQRAIGRALLVRTGSLLLALLLAGGAVFANFQDLASLMRNNRELRFLVTPANYLYSLSQVARSQAKEADKVREPVGTDAVPGASWHERKKPVVMVMVLGETARAANWGLSGYARQTTPELAAEAGIINFADVTSCGTDTETSLPCIFSPWGRRDYQETRIRSSESVLDVVARAGFRVVWVDNQSGCKGVCNGVESTRPDPAKSPALCAGGECQDGALVESLKQLVGETPGNLMIVLHQMGNHGPAYFKRYPDEFKQFTPACEDPDLPKCTGDSIVNAYDNAIRYTDHVVASLVRTLRDHAGHDSALLYVSDHGESLGEKGLFLHGVPYKIAPDVQTKVPMVMWFSTGFPASFKLDDGCVGKVAATPLSHDNIFHTLLGLLDVKTSVYAREMDFSAKCRKP